MYRVRPNKSRPVWPPVKGQSIDTPDIPETTLDKDQDPFSKSFKDKKESTVNSKDTTSDTEKHNSNPPSKAAKLNSTQSKKSASANETHIEDVDDDPAARFKQAQLKFQGPGKPDQKVVRFKRQISKPTEPPNTDDKENSLNKLDNLKNPSVDKVDNLRKPSDKKLDSKVEDKTPPRRLNSLKSFDKSLNKSVDKPDEKTNSTEPSDKKFVSKLTINKLGDKKSSLSNKSTINKKEPITPDITTDKDKLPDKLDPKKGLKKLSQPENKFASKETSKDKPSFTNVKLNPVKKSQFELPPPKSKSDMATDCEWKREAFGKNPKWGSQKSIDPPESPVSQTPPPIPAAPKDAQTNLNKNAPSDEKPKKIQRKNKNSVEKTNKKEKEVTKASKEAGIPPPPPPPPPSMIPNAPPPPPPPGQNLPENKVLAKARKYLVEEIKKASRTRPDWKTLMKDLEGGVKLKHVKSSDKLDRSSPILPDSRAKGGKFYYDSEKTDPVQNQLFAEIHRGVRLRRTRTDDRSRPDFQKLGLKKFRKQMTSEEKKAIPVDAPEALPSSSDDEEDIDKMRDDLKATKLQLADEIKKTKQMEREAKIVQIDIDSFKAEVKKLKRQLKEAGVHEVKPIRDLQAADMAPKLSKSMSKLRMKEEDMDFSDLDIIDEEIKSLQDQIDAQRKRAEKAEGKIEDLNQKMSLISNGSDEWELRSVYFEKKYKALQKDQGIELPDINCIAVQTDPIEVVTSPGVTFIGQPLPTKKSSSRKSFGLLNRMQSFKEEDEEESESSSEESETDSSEESEEEDGSENENASTRLGDEREENRLDRDVNFWQNKVSQVKDKERICRQERSSLRNKIVKYYNDMRTERKEYLIVKQELDEMASALREVNDDIDQEEDEEDEESESEEESSDSSDWWEDDTKKKPKKLKKRKPNKVNGEDKSEDENLEDISNLDNPTWPESSTENSDSDDEDEPLNIRIRKLQNRTTNHEDKLNSIKKESHNLKTQVTRCDEMYNEEKRRHQRFDNELQMLLTALE